MNGGDDRGESWMKEQEKEMKVILVFSLVEEEKEWSTLLYHVAKINFDFSAPQTGHDHSAGTFSNGTPGRTPVSPCSGS